jgi:amino acid transporter
VAQRDGTKRTIGLAGATGVGVGAIVGGGILALAGVAFERTGPGAMLAFGLNGVIAAITVLSFAALSSRFPESGGTYTFAKKVLSVEAAFTVGWVVWFASIVAAVLYAIGFAAFAALAIDSVWRSTAGAAPAWIVERPTQVGLAIAATVVYSVILTRRTGGGGGLVNISKVLVFGILIAGGLWAIAGTPRESIAASLTPFLPRGTMGLVQAMGFTFIALQGFDLIAAVAGEVKAPSRTIPRAMFISLGTALGIYLPLLLVVATVGVAPGVSITDASAEHPETIVAVAAGRYLGPFGYWLVVAAALLSMLSALQANLFAASRVAMSMARDRTLPPAMERLGAARGTPVYAILVTAAITVALLLVLTDVAAAGAAASLIFLITFALAHVICILARYRVGVAREGFRTPLFPLVPVTGGVLCLALAIFQAIAVPAAGMIAAAWLGVGGLLFLTLFAPRARVRDAVSEATDGHLLRLRGRSPLVLVPIANPRNAAAMVEVATSMAAPGVGRVTLLNIVSRAGAGDADYVSRALDGAQEVLRQSLLASFGAGLAPEALTTVADGVWREIRRVVHTHDCESLLLGFSNLDEHRGDAPIEELMRSIHCDTVVLRAAPDWRLTDVRRILVAIGGRGGQDVLRARLVASLCRGGEREITYLRAVRPGSSPQRLARIRRVVNRIALDEAHGRARVVLEVGDSPSDVITAHAAEHELVILGLQRPGRDRGRRIFGEMSLRIARTAPGAVLMISRGGR